MKGGNLLVKGGRFVDGANEGSLMLSGARAGQVGLGNVGGIGGGMSSGNGVLGGSSSLNNHSSMLNGNRPGGAVPITPLQHQASGHNTHTTNSSSSAASFGVNGKKTGESIAGTERYWKNPLNSGVEDVVLIHVCDENRQVSKDFCCKRNILVKHMRYFERFLAENENGYDDIDISVHCDVEIFEWLMSYIHEPDKPPVLDKAIVVSILISSEFLQMDTLVDLCLEHIANSLGEIIRLPIDLSCISDKLVNKLAALTSPKTLAQTKDRKDKILNKLYKRRVELDFSRKSNARGGARTIAASLTCCRYCGMVFLDNWVSMLTCRSSPPAIDFRGCLARRHSAISGWSLTSYLKTLHAGGMSWDAIYWRVWGACEVFKVGDVVISALEVDRYVIESDGIVIRSRAVKEAENQPFPGAENSSSLLPPRAPATALPFSLDIQEDDSAPLKTYRLGVSTSESSAAVSPPSPSSMRPCDTLPAPIFELLCSQARLVSGAANKPLIENTAKQIVQGAANAEEFRPFDYGEVLWADVDAAAEGDDERRGRSRSPARGGTTRKQAQSLTAKLRVSPSAAPHGSTSGGGGGGDSDAEKDPSAAGAGGAGSAAQENAPPQNTERRSRSMGTSFRLRGSGTSGGSTSAKKKSQPPGAAPRGPGAGGTTTAAGDLDAQTLRQLAILKAIPPDAVRRFNVNKGPVNSVWLAAHPLVLYPAAYADLMNTIQDSSISDNKKLEWELDVLREYDEKRLDRLEAYLVSRRNLVESQKNTFRHGANKDASAGASRKGSDAAAKSEYYKDRGRQAYKIGLAISS